MAKTKVVICPYCGETQPTGERCRACGGFFEPLSRQATHNAMGPWFVRDPNRPYQPGCSYETLIRLIERGVVNKYSIIRGPTTKQFWTIAKHVPGVSHLLGYCHNCDASVDAGDHGCHACGVPFGAYLDRNFLGLPDIKPLPWEASAEDDRRAAPASSRMLEFRRAAEPLGISSFASDEELRVSGIAPMPAYGQAAGLHQALSEQVPIISSPASHVMPAPSQSGAAIMPATSAQEDAEAAAVAGAAIDPLLSSAAARSMHRRLERQQRTIRLLSIIVLVMAGLSAISLTAMLLVNRPNVIETPATTPTQPPASDAASPAPVAPVVPLSEHPAEPPLVNPAAVESPQSAAPTEVNVTPADQAATLNNVESEYARAEEMMIKARDADRLLEDRIRDYQQALAIFREIEKTVPPDRQPAGLADRIKQVEHELEGLRLQQYFP